MMSNPAGIDCASPGPCSAEFAIGAVVTLTATPDPLFELSNWSGACTGTTCTVTLAADATATADFELVRYQVIDLGVLSGDAESVALDISRNGIYVVGESMGGARNIRPFVWDGAMHDMAIGFGSASAVNDAGQVAGVRSSQPLGMATVMGFLWQAGTVTDIGTLGGAIVDVRAISPSGIVVGSTRNAAGTPRAFLWNGRIVDLGSLSSASVPCSAATAIDANGVVVGSSCIGDGSGGNGLTIHAVRFRQPGIIDDLGTLPSGTDSAATGIDDAGGIVGNGDALHANNAGFLYSGGKIVDVGTLCANCSTQLSAINSSGVAVGFSSSARATTSDVGILYAKEHLHDVNDLTAPSPWTILRANAIDDGGDIVGLGVTGPGSAGHALLLRAR